MGSIAMRNGLWGQTDMDRDYWPIQHQLILATIELESSGRHMQDRTVPEYAAF